MNTHAEYQYNRLTMEPIEWLGDRVKILDQTKLPGQTIYLETRDYRQVADAIKQLKVRGAPAIGIAAAYGIAVGALSIKALSKADFQHKLQEVMATIISTRPTARNLFMAVERMRQVAESGKTVEQTKRALVDAALHIHAEEKTATLRLSQHGAELIEDGFTILTHCNTGPLATGGYGTALGVLIYAQEQGKKVHVFATETRPLLQGARLTACELQFAKIPFTLITDNMAGHFMRKKQIDCVIVGADRIAANGDTANKIGTYTLAVLAKAHGIPFYVAAPTTTIDFSIPTGDQITIEERGGEEVTSIQGVRIAPKDVQVANPAFDVTPHEYITAIITEKGIMREPFGLALNPVEGEGMGKYG